MIKDAILWSKLDNGRVECRACARLCKIPTGSQGFCFIRKNVNGKLKLASYGKLASLQLDPIEKKPFNHFLPGSYVLGAGTSSCNWGCQFCQNHNVSKEREVVGTDMTPAQLVDLAVKEKAKAIAFTYNEPTIFIEYTLDVAKIAHKKGLKVLFVTNGYMTKETVRAMNGSIDACVVNWKGNGEQKFANKYEMVVSTEPIKEAMLEMKRCGIHVEMTDLIIPSVGDSLNACDELTRWVAEGLGPETPVHFTRFFPDYKMQDYPVTPLETLRKHYDIAKRNGLEYVYVGNVLGNKYEHTYCPGCGRMAIGRMGYEIMDWRLDAGNNCKKCGTPISVVGGLSRDVPNRDIVALY